MQDIAGRLAIQQQVANHTYALDLCNWELFRSVFTPDADIDYMKSTPLRGTPDQIGAIFGLMASLPNYQRDYDDQFVRMSEDWRTRKLVEGPRWPLNAPTHEQKQTMAGPGSGEGAE